MKEIIRELILSILLSLILIFILSILLCQTSINESIIKPATIAIVVISLMLGGFRISKSKKQKGILYGSILGIIYMFILYLISSFANFEFYLGINSIIMIILGIIGGAVGGILGVNF